VTHTVITRKCQRAFRYL